MVQLLSMLVNDRQNGWDLHLSHAVLSYNNSVNAATGLSPNELHLSRYPRLPITVFERHTFDGHQGLDQDQLSPSSSTTGAFCILALALVAWCWTLLKS